MRQAHHDSTRKNHTRSHLALQIGEPVLGHTGRGGIELFLAQQLNASVREGAADGDLGLEGGQAVLDGLQIGQGCAEGLQEKSRRAIKLFTGKSMRPHINQSTGELSSPFYP